MSLLSDHALILTVALTLDALVGEPPERIHPVVWMGAFIAFFDRRIARNHPPSERRYGVLLTLATVVLFAVPCCALYWIRPHAPLAYILLSAAVLKTTFSIRALGEHARTARVDNLEEKRAAVALTVSRDTDDLGRAHLDSAAIESVAENLTDSIVSPVLYYALFGVPGAMAYRAVNTLDAMIGYKKRRYRHVGRFAARLDSALNAVPERIAAALICLTGGNRRNARETLLQGRRNGVKQTIAAMAGALAIGLEKKAVYAIGSDVASIRSHHIDDAVAIVNSSTLLLTGGILCGIGAIYLGGILW